MSRNWERSFIDKKICDGCGDCVVVCPVEAIELFINTDGKQKARVSKKCIGCGACLNICHLDGCIEIKLPEIDEKWT